MTSDISHNSTNTLSANDVNAITILQTCTAHIYKTGDREKYINCRIWLDCGSQRSYITRKVASELQLPKKEESCLTIYTFGDQTPREI